ncbi:amidohydrolase family protein [Sphingomonas sp. QA11]|uniref:amidohydrolase family protein n=1 Tax=Sphingomonas sp. QA11 TaxID=2950605 RepID=UPI0023497D0F|nr:amidohydrolase family protein [Sphingomonas sp. QA11]WCM25582.1 amidohydrolase family protein [Sphingomonas sp. QA11]
MGNAILPNNTARHGRKTRLAGRLLAATAGAIGLFATLPALAETLVVKNFTLIDGRGGAATPNSAMVVEDGRIVWVGPSAQAPVDAAAIDLTGKFVIPGLIDTHIHMGNVHDLTQDERFYTTENVEADLRTYASYGFTTVAVMGTDKDSVFAVRNAERAGRPTMTRLFTAGQGIVFRGGYGGVPGINRPVANAREAAIEVDAQAAKGADYIKFWLDDELATMPKMPPEISQAVIDAAHRNGLKVFAHIFYLEDAKRLAAQGVDGFVHSVRDKPVDKELTDAMKEKGIVQVAATLSREAAMFAYGKPAPQLDDPFFKQSLSPEALRLLASPERQKSVASAPAFPRLPGFFDTAMANLKREAAAGVHYGVGTDSGPPGRVAGYSGHWEMELMVKDGFTPGQAIQAATGYGAEILGAKDLGTIERAKWADFVVLDADPLKDIRNTRKINSVYIAGRKVRSVAQ